MFEYTKVTNVYSCLRGYMGTSPEADANPGQRVGQEPEPETRLPQTAARRQNQAQAGSCTIGANHGPERRGSRQLNPDRRACIIPGWPRNTVAGAVPVTAAPGALREIQSRAPCCMGTLNRPAKPRKTPHHCPKSKSALPPVYLISAVADRSTACLSDQP